MKKQRQQRILEIVGKYDLRTQEEITELLRSEGFKVTQATVSRDLRDLHLTKNTSLAGRHGYVANTHSERLVDFKLNSAIVETILSVQYAQNNIVIKTYPGMAQAVASGVDALKLGTILGSVAGDDTIIIVTSDSESAADISGEIRHLLKNC